MRQIDLFGGNTSLIKQLLYLPSNHALYDCNESCLIAEKQRLCPHHCPRSTLNKFIFFHDLFCLVFFC